MELLEVGSEAETCRMAGAGMNGLHGIVVCYSVKNSRYTLELDDGEMMSLRARNVKPICHYDDESEKETISSIDDKPSIVMVESVQEVESAQEDKEEAKEEEVKEKGEAPVEMSSPLPKANLKAKILKAKISATPATTKKTQANATVPDNPVPDNPERRLNIIDRIFFAIWDLFSDVTPSVMLIGIVSAMLFHKFMFGGSDDSGDSNSERSSHNNYEYDYYHPRYYRSSWHYWSWWPFGLFGVGGLFSVLVVSFFIYQWGTARGAREFAWDRVRERAMNMDFWEAMRMFALLEGAFYFIAQVARGNGNNVPRRRR